MLALNEVAPAELGRWWCCEAIEAPNPLPPAPPPRPREGCCGGSRKLMRPPMPSEAEADAAVPAASTPVAALMLMPVVLVLVTP